MINIDKSKYKKLDFGNMADQISERIDPKDSRAEIYVGLEHIEPDSIHIQKHGKPADVKGTKMKVYKDDIIFGKRRAYQRKAAISHFDGICSAHAMVLRAKPNIILPKLFPFFLHSNAFMHRAIDISEGSLSPTIKWKILKKQKFTVPPLDQQKQFANLLGAGDVLIQKNDYLRIEIEKLRCTKMKGYFIDKNNLNKIDSLPISMMSGLWKGKSDDRIDITVIRNTEFGLFGEIDFSNPETISVDKKYFKNKKLLRGDIILEMSGGSPAQPVGRVVYFNLDEKGYSFSNFTKLLRVTNKSKLISKYLFIILQTIYELGLTKRIQKQTTGIRNLDLDLYMSIKIPIPAVSEQELVVSDYEMIEYKRGLLNRHLQSTKEINRALINQIFE